RSARATRTRAPRTTTVSPAIAATVAAAISTPITTTATAAKFSHVRVSLFFLRHDFGGNGCGRHRQPGRRGCCRRFPATRRAKLALLLDLGQALQVLVHADSHELDHLVGYLQTALKLLHRSRLRLHHKENVLAFL